jgi:hypothetical protein
VLYLTNKSRNWKHSSPANVPPSYFCDPHAAVWRLRSDITLWALSFLSRLDLNQGTQIFAIKNFKMEVSWRLDPITYRVRSCCLTTALPELCDFIPVFSFATYQKIFSVEYRRASLITLENVWGKVIFTSCYIGHKKNMCLILISKIINSI